MFLFPVHCQLYIIPYSSIISAFSCIFLCEVSKSVGNDVILVKDEGTS